MRIGKSSLKVVAGVVLAIAGAASRADVAPEPLMTGGNTAAVRGKKDVPVQMLREEVDLRPSARRNEVVAVFALKNLGAETIEFEVGFPSYFQMPLKDFLLEVDGDKTAAELKTDEPAGPKSVFISWMCWPMKFAPAQEHKVKVSYWVEPEHPRSITRLAIVKGRRTITSDPVMTGEGVAEPLCDEVGGRASGYVLRTGAGWKNVIGSATIRLHYGEQFRKNLVAMLLPEKHWTYDPPTNTDTLVLENLKPTSSDDISYQWRLTDPATEKTRLLEGLRAGKLNAAACKQFVEVLGWNYQSIDHPKPTAQQLEVLQYCVAPAGPKSGDDQMADYMTLTFYRLTYHAVFNHYRESHENDRALAVGTEFNRFLDHVIAKWETDIKNESDARDRKILEKQLQDLRAERNDVTSWVAGQGT